MIVTTTDKKMIFKAMNGADHELKDYAGKEIIVIGAIQKEIQDSNGDDAICTILIDEKNETYSTISPTVQRAIESLAQLYFGHPGEDGITSWSEMIKIKPITKQSKNNRDFLTIELV